MSNRIDLARKVRDLKAGQPFTVKSERERQQVCRIAKALRDAGVIEFLVVTRRASGGFTVAAI